MRSAAAVSGPNHQSLVTVSFKHETKPFHLHPVDMPDPSPSSFAGPIRIDGSEHDAALSKSEFLTRRELLIRRSRRAKQLAQIYLHYYWALMEELKAKYREYSWEFGKSGFVEDEDIERLNSCRVDGGAGLAVDNGNGIGNASSMCVMNGCDKKPLALTMYCKGHILQDPKQKLYKACTSPTCAGGKSSATGSFHCVKPALRSRVPSYCREHFIRAEKQMARALKKYGLNCASTSKLAPKLHVIVAEYVRQIQQKRRTAKNKSGEC